MIRLIVNADDLGLSPSIDEGIFRAHAEGIVTSATVLVTGRTAKAAIERAHEVGLALGVHLCLSSSLPPAAPAREVPRLAPDGRFRRSWSDVVALWASGRLSPSEVELELRAQLEFAVRLGMQPDHLDGHQHLHLLPGIAEVVDRIADEHGLPLRWPLERPRRRWLGAPGSALKAALLSGLAVRAPPGAAQRIRGVGVFESGALDETRVLGILDELDAGNHELVCHPGLEGPVPEDPNWRYSWETELAALTSPRVRERVEQRGIILSTYASVTALT